MRATPAQRGYGYPHQQLRKRWAVVVARGEAVCVRCGRAIFPQQFWDLDHTEDRTAILGASHRRCNRRAGAIKGNKERGRVSRSRVW
jgi:hypothetical protein